MVFGAAKTKKADKPTAADTKSKETSFDFTKILSKVINFIDPEKFVMILQKIQEALPDVLADYTEEGFEVRHISLIFIDTVWFRCLILLK